MYSYCFIPVVPYHIIRYGELNPYILYTFSGFSLSDGIYMYLPTSALGYFPPLIYFRTFWLGCLLLHGAILTLLKYPSMICITFISALTALPTEIALLSFFAMNRVTRHLLSVRLLVPCRPVLLDPFKLLSGEIRCDRMRNELWGRSATESLNIISCGVLTLSWSM